MSPRIARALARVGGRRPRESSALALLRRRSVAYAAFTALVFAVALLESLPHDLIVRRALDEASSDSPVRIRFAELRYGFPNRYRLRRVELVPRGRGGPGVSVERLDLRVPLLGLLLGRRLVSFSGAAGEGSFDGWVSRAGDETSLSLRADRLRLDVLARPLLPPSARLAGTARLELEIAGDPSRPARAEGSARFELADVEAAGLSLGGLPVPAVSFSRIRGELELHGTRLQVEELSAAAPGVRIGLSGDVLLRRPAERSVLSLGLRAEVSPEADPSWRLARAALLPPRPPGAHARYSLRGTLARPVVR